MKYLKFLLLFSALIAPVGAQTVVGSPVLVNGTCNQKSGVTVDGSEKSEFRCDIAVIARTTSGTVLIQFTDKAGDDARILGFAGTIEGKQGFGADPTQMLAVERVYLASGAKPLVASLGTCIMNWSGLERQGGKVTSVLCAARAEGEGHDVEAIAIIEADPSTGG